MFTWPTKDLPVQSNYPCKQFAKLEKKKHNYALSRLRLCSHLVVLHISMKVLPCISQCHEFKWRQRRGVVQLRRYDEGKTTQTAHTLETLCLWLQIWRDVSNLSGHGKDSQGWGFINLVSFSGINVYLTTHIHAGQQDELVALIPYNDKRLKPRRTWVRRLLMESW